MGYTLKQTGTFYAIRRNNASYNAGNDITLAMEVLGKLNKSFRANVEQRLDGLYVCWGDGSCKPEGCNYVKVISYITSPYPKPISETITWNNSPYNSPCIPWTPSPTTPFPTVPWNPAIDPQPVTGWLCPKCGNGVSPYTSICPCNHKITITCQK